MPSVCQLVAGIVDDPEVVDEPETVASLAAEHRRLLRTAATIVVHDLTGPFERVCQAARDFEEQMARIAEVVGDGNP